MGKYHRATEFPVPARNYFVQRGDTLDSIAKRAYFDSNTELTTTKIRTYQIARRTDGSEYDFTVKSGDNVIKVRNAVIPISLGIHDDLFTALYHPINNPKPVLYIPHHYEEERTKQGWRTRVEVPAEILKSHNRERGIYLYIDGRLITYATNLVVTREINGMGCVEATVPSGSGLYPYQYPACNVIVNGSLFVTGHIYSMEPTVSKDGGVLKIIGYSHAADVMDSNIPVNIKVDQEGGDIYQAKDKTLAFRLYQLVNSGMGQYAEYRSNNTNKIPEMRASQTETIWQHLSKYAKQLGVLMGCSVTGYPIMYDVNTNGPVVRHFKLSDVMSWNTKFDGRKIYKEMFGYRQASTGREYRNVSLESPFNANRRYKVFRANETDVLQEAVNYETNQIYHNSIQFSITTPYTVDDNGLPFMENTIVSIDTSNLGFLTEDGEDVSFSTKLLINKVTYNYSKDGYLVTLDLVSPFVYVRDKVEKKNYEFYGGPWASEYHKDFTQAFYNYHNKVDDKGNLIGGHVDTRKSYYSKVPRRNGK